MILITTGRITIPHIIIPQITTLTLFMRRVTAELTILLETAGSTMEDGTVT